MMHPAVDSDLQAEGGGGGGWWACSAKFCSGRLRSEVQSLTK